MADEQKNDKDPTKTKAAAPKKAGAAKAAPAEGAAPKSAKPKAPRGEASARSKATPAAPEGERCGVEGCKQPVRAKGLCRKHFLGWRRGGDVGVAHRYKVCSKEGCRKKRMYGGLCEEHAGKAAPAPDAPAPAAA
jgi:hypothetical protein